MSTNHLNEKALLVQFSKSIWTASKRAPELEREAEAAHNADEGTVGARKRLLKRTDSSVYAAIVTTGNKAYNDHISMTLPWNDESWRIIPSANYFHYLERMKEHKAEFENLIAQFLPIYADLRARRQLSMGSLFNDKDWPSDTAIADKFGFRIKFLPLPAYDFRVNLNNEDVDEIRKAIMEEQKNVLAEANLDLYKRLYGVVANMANRLAQDDYGPRESLIENIREMVEQLPRLNLMGDQELADLGIRIQNELTGYQREDLKKGEALREEAQRKAAQIKSVMEAMMNRPR